MGRDEGGGKDLCTVNLSRGHDVRMSAGQKGETHAQGLVLRDVRGWLRQKQAACVASSLHLRRPRCSGMKTSFGMRSGAPSAPLLPGCVTVGKPLNLSDPQMLYL